MTLPSGMNKTTVEQGGKKTRKSKKATGIPPAAVQVEKKKTAKETLPADVPGEKKTPKSKVVKESPRPEHFSTLGRTHSANVWIGYVE